MRLRALGVDDGQNGKGIGGFGLDGGLMMAERMMEMNDAGLE